MFMDRTKRWAGVTFGIFEVSKPTFAVCYDL